MPCLVVRLTICSAPGGTKSASAMRWVDTTSMHFWGSAKWKKLLRSFSCFGYLRSWRAVVCFLPPVRSKPSWGRWSVLATVSLEIDNRSTLACTKTRDEFTTTLVTRMPLIPNRFITKFHWITVPRQTKINFHCHVPSILQENNLQQM